MKDNFFPGIEMLSCGSTWPDRIRNEDVRAAAQTAPAQLKMRVKCMRFFGLSAYFHPPTKIWRDVIKEGFAKAKVTAEDAVDRKKWGRLTRTADPATRTIAKEKKKKSLV
nr:unnamed protein product [Haemonchus contortus]